jgi:hypothetical protein
VGVVLVDADKNDRQKSSGGSSSYSFQYSPVLTYNEDRLGEHFLKFLFLDIRVAHFIVRLSRLFVVSECDSHVVMT